jgi:hypothetical protein
LGGHRWLFKGEEREGEGQAARGAMRRCEVGEGPGPIGRRWPAGIGPIARLALR